MKEIDCNDPPEGATHWSPSNGIFYKYDDGELKAFLFDSWQHSELIESFRAGLIARHAGWNGEGLPPVGTVCEMKDDRGSWLKVEIIASHAGYSHGWSDVCTQNFFADDPQDFRPIRTPEQIAADEREAAIDQMTLLLDTDRGRAMRLISEALYDAGYRKP
jgi:hypothetical protein